MGPSERGGCSIFSFSTAHSYSFSFDSVNEPGHATFHAAAHGDLDGDGLVSTFWRSSGRIEGRNGPDHPTADGSRGVKSSRSPRTIATERRRRLDPRAGFGRRDLAREAPRRRADLHRLRASPPTVYPLVAPNQMVVASLGYRSAAADAIFAHVLVSYGLHFQERRRFEFVGDYYLDAMNALDPTFLRDPYPIRRHAARPRPPKPPGLEHYVKAREVLLRGLENRPYDTELWSQTGQYLAYVARPYLPPAMEKEWVLEGAKILAHACELASKNENVPYHCITAASLLNDAGEREAAIDSLRRLIAVSDDPDIQRLALGYLRVKLDARDADLQEHRRGIFREAWQKDLPFISKNMMLVIGPRVDTAFCAGTLQADNPACTVTWRQWARVADPTKDD